MGPGRTRAADRAWCSTSIWRRRARPSNRSGAEAASIGDWLETFAAKHPARLPSSHLLMKQAPLGTQLLLRLVLLLGQLAGDQQQGQTLVGVLAAFALHLEADAAGQVRGTHRRVRGVDVLTARTGGAQGFEADLAFQVGRRRGKTRAAKKPVLAPMARPVRADADPLQRTAPR